MMTSACTGVVAMDVSVVTSWCFKSLFR